MKKLLLLIFVLSFSSFAQESGTIEDQISMTRNQIDRFLQNMQDRTSEQVVSSKEYDLWSADFVKKTETALAKFEEEMKHKVFGLLKPKVTRHYAIYNNKDMDSKRKETLLKASIDEIKSILPMVNEQYKTILKNLFYFHVKSIVPTDYKLISNKRSHRNKKYRFDKVLINFYSYSGALNYSSQFLARKYQDSGQRFDFILKNGCHIDFKRTKKDFRKIWNNHDCYRNGVSLVYNFVNQVSFEKVFKPLIKGCSVKICVALKMSEIMFYLSSIESDFSKKITFNLPKAKLNSSETVEINPPKFDIKGIRKMFQRNDYPEEIQNWPFSDNY